MNDLDQLIRRVDEDRWLASRFAPPDARARLISLYAVNYEIARTAEVVREAALGDIRLEWWRSALADLSDDAARQHPALQALRSTYPNAAARMAALAEAHRADLEATPFVAWIDVQRYVNATAGEVMRLAVEACDPEPSERMSETAWPASHAWGYAGLLRAAPLWQTRGRSVFPREEGGREEMLRRAEEALASARRMGAAPAAALPAIGYVALTPAYLRALRRGAPEPSLAFRQLRLIAAVATGRL